MKDNILGLGSIALVGQILQNGLRYLLYILIGQLLGADALGKFSFGLMLLALGSIMAKFGLDNAGLKFVPIHLENDDDDRLTGLVIVALTVPLVLGAAISAAIFLARSYIEAVTVSAVGSIIPLFVVGIPLLSAMLVAKGLTRGFKETKYDVYIDNLQSALAVMGVLVATAFSSSILPIVVTYILSLAVGLLAGVWILYRLGAFSGLPTPEFQTRRILEFSGPVLFMALALKLVTVTDVFMLGVFEEASVIGIYQSAFQTALFLTMGLMAMNAIFPSVASELYEGGELAKLQRLYAVVSKWLFSITILGYVYMVVYGRTILGMFGAEFRAAWYFLVILALGQTIAVVTGPAGLLLIMTENERIEMVNTWAVTLLNLVLNVVLISRFGAIGAAVATSISISLLNVARMMQVKVLLDMVPYSSDYAKHVLAVILIAPVPVITHRLLYSGTIPGMLMLGGVTLGGLLLVLYWLGLDDDDYLLVESVK